MEIKIHSALTHIVGAMTALTMCFFVSCSQDDGNQQAEAVVSRAEVPTLDSRHVTTLISDSGITRYRIEAEVWQIYDSAVSPYWDFPQGLYLERFDAQFHVEASLRAQTARYFQQEGLWQLDGHVEAQNMAGERFSTPQLFWNQNTRRIYSDSIITIRKTSSLIRGIGFDSNQEMTQWVIRKPIGELPIRD